MMRSLCSHVTTIVTYSCDLRLHFIMYNHWHHIILSLDPEVQQNPRDSTSTSPPVQTAAFGVSHPPSVCRVEPLLEPRLHCNGGSEGCIVDNAFELVTTMTYHYIPEYMYR